MLRQIRCRACVAKATAAASNIRTTKNASAVAAEFAWTKAVSATGSVHTSVQNRTCANAASRRLTGVVQLTKSSASHVNAAPATTSVAATANAMPPHASAISPVAEQASHADTGTTATHR
jgi:hypothetical protein